MNSKRVPENTIVIGAYSAIAAAWAELRAGRGDTLFLVGRDLGRLELLANHLTIRYGVKVHTATADMTDGEACRAVIDRAFSELSGPVHRVLIAHGVLGDQSAAMSDVTLAREIIEVNFISYVALLAEIVPRFSAQTFGSIICISSVAGDRGRAKNFVYGSAKAGLSAYLSGLRASLHGTGVRVFTVKPGLVDSPMTVGMKKGPLFSSPECVARDMVFAEERGRFVFYTPFWWRWIMALISWLPESVFMRLRF